MGDGMRKAVVLVGHGGVPKDYPHDLVITLKRLEAHRRGTGGDPSEEEGDLDRRIRHWPRTPFVRIHTNTAWSPWRPTSRACWTEHCSRSHTTSSAPHPGRSC